MTIEQYLAKVDSYPLLTPEKELEAARSAKAGNQASREVLILSNLRLVIYIAKKYSRNGHLEDLIQQGNIGLIEAADRFDPALGYRFSTYAVWRIKKWVSSYCERQDMVRLPPKQRALRKRIYTIIRQYVVSKSEKPSPENIAEELNRLQTEKKYTARDVQKLLRIYEYIKIQR